MLDMFYSCFHSMLRRAPWLTIQMQFLIPVQTHDSPIISTLCPRKDIYWQQLFRLQLSTFQQCERRPHQTFSESICLCASRDSGNSQHQHKSCDMKPSRKSQNPDFTSGCCCPLPEEVSKCQWWSHLNGEAEYSQQEKLSFTCAGARTYDLIYLYRKNLCCILLCQYANRSFPTTPPQFSPHILKLRLHNFVAP